VRYRRPSAQLAPSTLPVSGYGVGLALKRTDYIVIDDRESASTPSPDAESKQAVLTTDDEFADLKPLSTSELATLGLKAASFILQSDDALDTLVRLTQDLPKFSAAIAAHDVNPEFHEEHRRNRMRLGPSGSNALWVNGIQLNERQVEPFGLVEMLRRERNFVTSVQDLGLSGKEFVDLLGHDSLGQTDSGGDGIRFDWRDDHEDGKAILWLNDIENDQAYERHPDSYRVVSSSRFE
jgi:UDP-glucose:glycoprotein glucosyltransferase